MADLVAQGPEPEQTWQRTLQPGKPITIGRGELCEWAAEWDRNISRLHATVTFQDGKLQVRRNAMSRNPVFYRGQKVEQCVLGVGDFFLIGRTRFTLVESEGQATVDIPSPLAEFTCSAEELDGVRYTDAADRIEVLAKLPSMIRFSPTEEEFQRQAAAVLLAGIPRADAAAVVWMDPRGSADTTEIKVSAPTFREGLPPVPLSPSRRLIQLALRKVRQPVMHRWITGQSGDFTVTSGYDWALCAPLPDDPAPGWSLYAIGRTMLDPLAVVRPHDAAEKEDLKFAGLVADIFGALRQVRDLQRRKTMLESFMNPTVLAALAYHDMEEVLKPRRTEVTVLFCDLRGFSRITEGEVLEDICDRVSEALGVMTRNILDKEGVISDFQGDAAMGFWGWPFAGEDQVEQAVRAALAIRREFQQFARQKDHPLSDFACGIGLAHGPAIAGRLGTLDQFKVGVFGPVVNLAARLESLTKTLRVPILADDSIAEKLGGAATSKCRLRRLARLQPYGMTREVFLHEVMPRHEAGGMSERDQADYEAALAQFLEGQWAQAHKLLALLPCDGPSQFLLRHMQENGGQPPPGWKGVIVATAK
jgi:adenylate cyclase